MSFFPDGLGGGFFPDQGGGIASVKTGGGSFTLGAVLFGGTDGKIDQDPTKFVYDNTNNRLGIGVDAPVSCLELKSTNGDDGYVKVTNQGGNTSLFFGCFESQLATVGTITNHDFFLRANNTDFWFVDSATGQFTSNTDAAKLAFRAAQSQTTVGAAGGASALPATPTGYLMVFINGTERVIPYYAKA